MMATVFPMPGAMTPVGRILSAFNRDQIAGFIEVAIGLLDVADLPDDPDEPDFAPRSDRLPGDPADTEPDDDAKGDQAWTEWHTRGRHKLARGTYEMGNTQAASHLEDTEDDDPRKANGDELDGSAAEDEELSGITRYYADKGPGCPISDIGIGDMDGLHTA